MTHIWQYPPVGPADLKSGPEYQLIYLSKGQGTFFSETTGRKNPIRVKAGDAFILFPGEWHTYMPDGKRARVTPCAGCV